MHTRHFKLLAASIIVGILIVAAEWFYSLADAVAGMIGMLGFVMLMLSLAFGLLNLILEGVWTSNCKQASVAGLWMIVWGSLVIASCSISDSVHFRLAMDYPARVGAALERFHQQHGRYPDDLSEIPALPRCPLRESYFGNGKNYIFFYSYGGFFSGYSYSSETKTWVWTSG